MRKVIPASGEVGVQPLPPELEARIAAIEAAGSPGDFDRRSALWMVLLGVILPILCLLLGWYLPGGP
jgi:hypothetical protein